MNPIIQFFSRTPVQIFIIITLVAVIIWLISENFTDTFSNDDFDRVPPHIEQLMHQQLVPQDPWDPPAYSQDPSDSNKDGMSIDPPNYGRENQEITPDNTRMVPGNIYRSNTGRNAYQQEQFVSIYDSNFGGMLGTSMGL